MSGLVAVSAFAAGYVLGAKAGRARYERIRRAFGRLTDAPPSDHGATQLNRA